MSPVNLVDMHLDAVDWNALRAMASAAAVPDAVRALVAAGSEHDADAAYWRLDNNVVVQGQLFESALPLVPVLLAALAGPVAEPARVRLADLLVEIASGTPDESERERGNGGLGRACRAAVAEGLWLVYSLLQSDDARLRERAVQVVYAAEPDREKLARVLDDVAASDADARVRNVAAEFQRYMPGVIFDDDAGD
jgi:hypothetical protein